MNDNDRNDDLVVGEPGGDTPATLAALYALGALNDRDAETYEDYLASSVDAKDEAAAFAATADLLGADVEPPASLKASIMASIASLPQLPALNDDAHETASALPSSSTASSETDASTGSSVSRPVDETLAAGERSEPPVRPMSGSVPAASPGRASKAQQKARSRWFSGPASVLVAAAAVVAVLVGTNVITSALNNGNGLQEASRLAYIEAQPDATRETIRLTNIADEQQLTATLVWSGNLAESVFIVDGLASLPEDKTYELWYIGEDGPVSAGVFNTGREGGSWRVLDGSMAAGDAVGVTVEPAGGSEQPTTDPLIVIRTT